MCVSAVCFLFNCAGAEQSRGRADTEGRAKAKGEGSQWWLTYTGLMAV